MGPLKLLQSSPEYLVSTRMSYLAVTLKKLLPFSKKHSYEAWKQGPVWMSAWLLQCDAFLLTPSFRSPDIAYVQMLKYMPLMSGAGLGAET